jgi:serine/threonine-protein kinase RsbT
MIVTTKESIRIVIEQDVILFRNRLKEFATRIGMNTLTQTKLITAASELMRNMLKYANGGQVLLEIVSRKKTTGIRVTFTDNGPGIANVQAAMEDGYSTGQSLGLGLPGARRLVNEFDIKSEAGKGTTVTIICWKNGI